MKRNLAAIMVLISLPLFADYDYQWKIARPNLKTSESSPCQEWFEEAYVEYFVSKDERTMHINLHDQFVRTGFWPTRLYNKEGGTWGCDADHEVGRKLLKRVFALTSGIAIDPQTTNLPYFMKPNFSLLDDFLESIFLNDIVDKFTEMHPKIAEVILRTSEKHHPYKIGHLTVDKSFQDWKKSFGDISLSFDITDVTYSGEEEQQREDGEDMDKGGKGQ